MGILWNNLLHHAMEICEKPEICFWEQPDVEMPDRSGNLQEKVKECKSICPRAHCRTDIFQEQG